MRRLLIPACFLAILACEKTPTEPQAEPLRLLAVSAGYYHTCGLDLEGMAWCWGEDRWAQLGFAADSACDSELLRCSLHPGRVAIQLPFTALRTGGGHTCALGGGNVYCWGANQFGQSGAGAPPGDCSVACASDPFPVYLSQAATALSAGDSHSCAVREDGTSACWGYGAYGRIGNGSSATALQPAFVGVGEPFTMVEAGGSHTCAVTASHAAWCWGYNHLGQLGDGSTVTREVPTRVAPGLRFTAISAGIAATCAISEAGQLYCWGASGAADSSGTCSAGVTAACATAPLAQGSGLAFTSVSVGLGYACGVATQGSYCWGRVPGHQLPIRDPVAFGTLGTDGGEPFVTVTAGYDHACGLTAAHEAWCWGSNYHGMLGDGTEIASSRPVRVVLAPAAAP